MIRDRIEALVQEWREIGSRSLQVAIDEKDEERASRLSTEGEVLRECADRLSQLLAEEEAALRANRPEPAADAVEAVARAICRVRWPDDDPSVDTLGGLPRWRYFEDEALAALAAAQETGP